MENYVVCLIGPPGVGKLTVARELCDMLGFKVVDNHYWLNPILGLIPQDGISPLPDDIWRLTSIVRAAVLETVALHSPAAWSFVFTHSSNGNPKNHALDNEVCAAVASLVEQRRGRAIAVQLTCAAEELSRRVGSRARRQLMKDQDVDAALRGHPWRPFDPGWKYLTTIETTFLSARQTAERIAQAVHDVAAA